MRLFLVGDDEALDVLADLSRYLDYAQVARLDDAPDEPLGPGDHLVVGAVDRARGRALLDGVAAASPPGFAVALPPESEGTAGVRAILVAAQLVAAFRAGASN